MVYHVNNEGDPGLCQAVKGNCPFGDASQHYETIEEAREVYEIEMGPETIPPPRKLAGKLTRQEAIELDQFFTKDELAIDCLSKLSDRLETLGYYRGKIHFVEPSAGGGSFVRAAETVFPGASIVKGDIAPKDNDTVSLDFINDDYKALVQGDDAARVVIGNPPFGYKGRMAQDFINRSFEFSDTVVMVLPVQFQKYGTQNGIVSDAKLIYDETLPYDAFTVNGSNYGVQCCFQIWTKRSSPEPDLRKREKPPIEHEDFKTWYVSSKPESKRHLQEADWDYAVVSQGFKGQFELVERKDADRLALNKHYMLMKGNSPEALERLKTMDFESLANRNTTRIKGFGKADLVDAYINGV